MNLKDFFKPNKFKITLTAILFVILFFVNLNLSSCLGGRPCPEDYVNYNYPFTCHYLDECIPSFLATFYIIVTYLIFLAISYLISCCFAVFIKKK